MSLKKKFVASMIIGSASIAAMSDQAMAKSHKMEKCYGVVKASQNDCGDSKGVHSCAGAAKADALKSEWIFLPKGTCDRIVGGSLKG